MATLFFANAIVGMLWESRSLASGREEVILAYLWYRGLAGVAPLVVVFAFMVYKPDIPAVASWFR